MVVRQLTEGRIVAFARKTGIYLFTGQGAFKVPLTEDVIFPMNPDDGECNFWLFIDFDADKMPPPRALWAPLHVFPVHVASPDEQRYKVWMDARPGSFRIMDPWSEDEIRAGYALYPLRLMSAHRLFP